MNKKSIIGMFLLLSLVFLLSACQLPFFRVVRGSGEVVTETYNVSDFSEIRLDGAGQLVVTQGSSESLEIQAEDNVLDNLTVEVQGDTLVLGFKERSWRNRIIPTRTIVYTLSVVDLTSIEINGAADLSLPSLETSSLSVEISGAGNIEIDELRADALSVNLSGAGSIEISGEVNSQTIVIEGTGNYQAEDLKSQKASIEISGLGNGQVWVEDSLDVTISGGGSVEYFGSPSVTQDVSGLGDIRRAGDK
jgi:hypothetical protein